MANVFQASRSKPLLEKGIRSPVTRGARGNGPLHTIPPAEEGGCKLSGAPHSQPAQGLERELGRGPASSSGPAGSPPQGPGPSADWPSPGLGSARPSGVLGGPALRAAHFSRVRGRGRVPRVRRGAWGRPGGNLLLPEADSAAVMADEPACQRAQAALSPPPQGRWAAWLDQQPAQSPAGPDGGRL